MVRRFAVSGGSSGCGRSHRNRSAAMLAPCGVHPGGRQDESAVGPADQSAAALLVHCGLDKGSIATQCRCSISYLLRAKADPINSIVGCVTHKYINRPQPDETDGCRQDAARASALHHSNNPSIHVPSSCICLEKFNCRGTLTGVLAITATPNSDALLARVRFEL